MTDSACFVVLRKSHGASICDSNAPSILRSFSPFSQVSPKTPLPVKCASICALFVARITSDGAVSAHVNRGDCNCVDNVTPRCTCNSYTMAQTGMTSECHQQDVWLKLG